ncbi:MAG: endo-1,4-beta-xylanase [Bacteroidaceae bacterium]|nr:endo-1,4-beta-xylanase [Bacteroidaceae bacterium]
MKKQVIFTNLLVIVFLMIGLNSWAQLSKNPDKFLGNITTRGQVEGGGGSYYTMWNQITPENETKWASVQGNRSSFNWGGADNSYNYAKQHHFPFKFHCFIWGSQYPSWIESLSAQERYDAIVKWMDAAKAHYPDLQLIDVANEVLPGHQQGTHFFEEALGGGGKSGYDWLVKAFEMVHERWPNAILIYNDFNTFQWNTDDYINLVRTIRDAGAPVDAYGCQSHDLKGVSASTLKSVMNKIHNALQMPMYISEYDIGTTDDQAQLKDIKAQLPLMWEADYCAGVTFWGYIYGATWIDEGDAKGVSGLIRDGKDRPAMTWIREYMKTDAAINAKSPFPGMKKEISLYIRPKAYKATINEPTSITVTADMVDSSRKVDHIDFYINNTLVKTMTEAPYVVEYTPTSTVKYNLKAVVTTEDGKTFERLGSITGCKPRSPYKQIAEIPGVIEFENFDQGGEGVSFHDSDSNNEGDIKSYRTDAGGVDLVKGNGGVVIGYTNSGEWLEYTVDVKEAGTYAIELTGSSGVTNSSIRLSAIDDEGTKILSDNIVLYCVKESSWDNYRTVYVRLNAPLKEGKQTLHVDITGSSCNIDKVEFKRADIDAGITMKLSANPSPAEVGSPTIFTFTNTSKTAKISKVRLYTDNMIQLGVAEIDSENPDADITYEYTPTAKGSYVFTAVAVDTEGKESKYYTLKLTVNNPRSPFNEVITVPGVIEAENFDKGGEGLTFHYPDASHKGSTASYRNDCEGIDLVKIKTGEYAVSNLQAGEWLEYTVDVDHDEKYNYEITYASKSSAKFNLSLADNGKVVSYLQDTSLSSTGGTSTYAVKSGKTYKTLSAGRHVIRFTAKTSGFNVDKLVFISTETGIDTIAKKSSGNYNIYTTTGVFVGSMHSDSENVVTNLRRTTGKQGIFIVKDADTQSSRLIMVK